jgi:serine/alanine adding enzyme
MELKVIESPGEEWNEFASQYTDLIFYQSVWSEVLRKGLGGQPLYFCLKEKGRIVAGLPGVLLNFKIIKILYASLPYGNLIGEKAYYQPFMECLDATFQKKGIDQVRLTESPFLESYQPKPFKSVFAKCSFLNLKGFDEEKIEESYRSEVRRAIRKARKNGLSIKTITSPKEVEVFYQMYLSSMKRNRAAAKYPRQWFEALYEILIQTGKGNIFFAMKGDQHAAGVVLIDSATSHHYFHNGSEEAYLESRPNDLIVDWIIKKGVKEGKATLDFMGSDPKDMSLIRFKEKWGSQSVDIFTYVKNYHSFRCKIWEWGKRLGNSRVGNRVLNLVRQ